MAGAIFGSLLTLSTFGESHGPAMGGILSGCPAGLTLDFEAINFELSRRKPGQSAIVTQRKEPDGVKFLSGIYEGVTTGTPIGFVVENANQKSGDYDHLKSVYRPSHADYTYEKKYGHRDHRGGGRASARETVSWVVAGAIAKQIIPKVKISAYVSAVGPHEYTGQIDEQALKQVEQNVLRAPDLIWAKEMEEFIKSVRKEGDTVGGVISCHVDGVPLGWGSPVFEKLHASLGKAMLTINAVKGFEYGSGFQGAKMRGSAHNDLYRADGRTQTNYSGGIQGGISNGEPIFFRVAFKPVATLMQTQEVLDKDGQIKTQGGKGRHDPCVVPRAVPIVEAMTALVLADAYLMDRTTKI
ncbi:chorismate synthase [Flavobacteriaceae bacterium]|nr:chorismate synthase [Flavobacteriaceae bacterium]